MKNYVSNENESVKMFNSNFLEYFTHVHPIVPIIIFLPAIAYLIYFSFILEGVNLFYGHLHYFYGKFMNKTTILSKVN